MPKTSVEGQIADLSPGEKLQQMSALCHWAVADSALLQAIIRCTPVQRGAAGSRLRTLLKFFAKFRLVYLLLLVVGAFALTRLWLQHRRIAVLRGTGPRAMATSQPPAFFFVGFGAGPEEALFAAYCAGKRCPVARVDQTRVETMGRWHRIGFRQALASLNDSLSLAQRAMASLPPEFKPWQQDFLTFIGSRLAIFSFASAWFAQLKSNVPRVSEVCFLAADTAAFAAVNAGLPTRLLQHGLIRHSLVLPAFAMVDALTHDEMLHFRRRLPAAAVRLARPLSTPVAPGQPACILVASVYGPHKEMQRILPFLEFATQRGMAIHVRPHPREDRSFWRAGDLPFAVSLDDGDASFAAALERLRPVFVVSWFSTALVDALYRSVIPVTVSALDDPNIQDMVYPLFSHSLHWPSDQAEMDALISNDLEYATTLQRLRSGIA